MFKRTLKLQLCSGGLCSGCYGDPLLVPTPSKSSGSHLIQANPVYPQPCLCPVPKEAVKRLRATQLETVNPLLILGKDLVKMEKENGNNYSSEDLEFGVPGFRVWANL